jgi:hypothetical protein
VYCGVSIQRIRKLDGADTQREREREGEREERERQKGNVEMSEIQKQKAWTKGSEGR